MRLPNFSILGAVSFAVAAPYSGPFPSDAVDALAASSLVKLKEFMTKNPAAGNCTFESTAKRKEW